MFDAFTSATHVGQWCAPKGGKITTTPAQLRDAPDSPTGEYLRRTERVAA